MYNKEFGINFELRTKNFALDIIRLSCSIKSSTETNIIKNQVTKSGTSIGANYREANRLLNSPDFEKKIKICESEASETQYWLELINELKWCSTDVLKPLLEETSELLAIFRSIQNNLT